MSESTARTVWFVSAVHSENTNSTSYLLDVLVAGLSRNRTVRSLVPRSGRAALAGPAHSRLGRWFAGRAWHGATRAAQVAVTALREIRPHDVVLVVTNPPVLPILMAWVTAIRRARLVVIVHDVYPDALYALGVVRPGSLMGRLLERLILGSLRRADRIVVVGRDMERLIGEKLRGDGSTVVYVPNWSDPDLSWNATDRDPDETLVVQYSGNMGATHAVHTLVESAAQLQRDRVPVRFQLYGWGHRYEEVCEEVRRLELGNTMVGGPCTREELGQRLAGCDVAAILMRRGMAGISVPSRLYNVLAAGKPLIVAADSESEIAVVVHEHELGWVVPPEDPTALEDAVRDAVSRRQELKAMGQRAAALAEQDYSLDQALRRYRALLDELAPG